MAAKEWQVTQTLTKNGSKSSTTFKVYGEAADVNSLTAMLEGGYQIKEVNAEMSNMTAAETNVSQTNPVSLITLSGKNGQVSFIKPYNGAIHFKESISAQDIANALANVKPFILAPSEKPVRVSVKRFENYATA